MNDETKIETNLPSEQQTDLSVGQTETDNSNEALRENPFDRDPSLKGVSESIYDYARNQVLQRDIHTKIIDEGDLSHHINSTEIIEIKKEEDKPFASITLATELTEEEVEQNLRANNKVQIIEEAEPTLETEKKGKKYKVVLTILVSVGALLGAGMAAKRHFDKESSH